MVSSASEIVFLLPFKPLLRRSQTSVARQLQELGGKVLGAARPS